MPHLSTKPFEMTEHGQALAGLGCSTGKLCSEMLPWSQPGKQWKRFKKGNILQPRKNERGKGSKPAHLPYGHADVRGLTWWQGWSWTCTVGLAPAAPASPCPKYTAPASGRMLIIQKLRDLKSNYRGSFPMMRLLLTSLLRNFRLH